MTSLARTFLTASMAAVLIIGFAKADKPADPAAVSSDNGEYRDKDGKPTYKVDKDGKVDFYSYIGYVRYTANCMHCHGPDGLGSTYAPSLVNSLKSLDYTDVMTIVASGKKDVNQSSQLVMPALGEDKNVMCFIDAIYIYLRARSDGAIDRGRPMNHEPKPKGYSDAEDSCLG
ncbi:MAG: c-type cytochrome, methanol metabolism-related [Rhodopila sp.]